MKVYLAIIAVMREVGAIAKERRNQQGSGYNFRGIEDVYNNLNQILKNNGLITAPRCLSRTETSYETKNGTAMIRSVVSVEYDFIADDGSKLTVGPIFGEANDSSDKSTNKAMSAAHKYMFFQTFVIPTEELIDADTESPENPKQEKDVKQSGSVRVDGGGSLASKPSVRSNSDKESAGEWQLPEDKGPSLCKGLKIKEIKKEIAYDYLAFMEKNMKRLNGWPKEYKDNLNAYWEGK